MTNDTIAICVSAGTVAVTVVGAIWRLALKGEAVITSVKLLTDRIVAIEKDGYRLPHAAEIALRTAIENPGMRVPDPRCPDKIIVVHPTVKGTSGLN